eukprot:gene35874-44237_t
MALQSLPRTNATIHDNLILVDLDRVRLSMDVCPQHDVLFENLTVRAVKGASCKDAITSGPSSC